MSADTEVITEATETPVLSDRAAELWASLLLDLAERDDDAPEAGGGRARR